MNYVGIVTGAGSGIGMAVTKSLVAKGYRIYALDKNPDSILQFENMPNVVPLRCDVSKREDIDFFYSLFSENEESLDLLFNGVGWMKLGGILDVEEKDWDYGFLIHIKSVIQLIQGAIPYLLQSKNSVIINLSSVLGETREEKAVIYTVMKSALSNLTKCLAKELAPKQIRVNAILPGPIQTPFVTSFSSETKKVEGASKLVMKLARAPIGRTGKPEEIANLVAYLASTEASYITGSCISIDGGWSL